MRKLNDYMWGQLQSKSTSNALSFLENPFFQTLSALTNRTCQGSLVDPGNNQSDNSSMGSLHFSPSPQ